MRNHFSRVRHQKGVSIPLALKLSPAMAALAGTTIAGSFGLGAALPAHAVLVANYQFQNTLSSTIASAPDLTPLAPGTYSPATIGGNPVTVYNFGRQGGLSLNSTGLISDNYTIAILISLDDISGWRKIFDFKNLTNDDGLYIYNGELRFWPINNVGPAVNPATFFQTVLTRASSTNLISIYLGGAPVISFTDSSASGVISTDNLLNFSQDDSLFGAVESSSGSVAGIRIFNHVLTATEVADLDLIGTTGSPPTAVPAPLPLLGFAAAFGWSRNLRRRLRSSSTTV